ncbi:MAG: hypothetical protein O2782_19825 [bacterium]|nr:hypothetical protein [bacterium]
MKRFAILLSLLLPVAAMPQQSGLGVGPFVGSAIGMSAKGWANNQYAVAAGLGVSVEHDNSMQLHADYLIHSSQAPQKLAFFRNLGGDGLFLAYYGAGGQLKLFDTNRLGVRATVGLTYAAGNTPWDAYIEVVPVLDVIPDSDWAVTAYVGWRWFVDANRASAPVPAFGQRAPRF